MADVCRKCQFSTPLKTSVSHLESNDVTIFVLLASFNVTKNMKNIKTEPPRLWDTEGDLQILVSSGEGQRKQIQSCL